MPPVRILYVEDNEDIRETMAMLLAHEGYQVTALPTAEEGLLALGRTRYDLLLADYQLPRENAAWLIAQARERGILGETPIIVLTGANETPGVEGCRLLRKPISQEALFAAFDAVLAERPKPAPVIRPEAILRLRLYVSGTSRASHKAIRNLERVLQSVDERLVDVALLDIEEAGDEWAVSAEEDRIVVIPTLVRHAPAPKVWVAGDLSGVEVVREAILPASITLLR